MKWVSVKDRLPKIGEDILEYHPADKNDAHNWPKGIQGSWKAKEKTIKECFYTHWMPLPNPPK